MKPKPTPKDTKDTIEINRKWLIGLCEHVELLAKAEDRFRSHWITFLRGYVHSLDTYFEGKK